MSFGGQFLRYPDLFPARFAGDRCGDESVSIDLPCGPYLLEGLSPSQRTAVEARYGDWRAPSDSSASVRLEVYGADAADFVEPQGPGLEYMVDLDSNAESLRIAAFHFAALVERIGYARVGVWTCESQGDSFIGVIENVLRPLVAHRVLSSGGLMLHSSGIVVGNRCFVFVGHSGAGKSTIAGMALERGHKVLSDDMNCILRKDDRWVAFRMPFAGDHQGEAEESEYPVAAVLRLTKGSKNRIDELSAADCFSLLLGSSPYVNSDELRSTELEETIERVIESLPSLHLTFRRDEGVWPIIEAR